MGFFKKKKAASKVDVLSGEGMLSFIRDNLKNPTDENVLKAMQEINRPDADQEHLTKEGNLPWGWYNLNRHFTEQIHKEYSYFLNEWLANRNAAPKRRLETLESFVSYMNDVQKVCYEKDECFAHWFDSVIASPEYIAERIAELNELHDNFAEIEAAYRKREKELAGLEERVEQALRQNEGILQADFVKLFDASVKNDVLNLLYHWDKEGKLSRIKSGRSYSLYIK